MRISLQQKNTDFTSGPILGRVILYTIPLMLSSMLQLLYNAADTIVVGRFGSTQSLAAVGSTGTMVTLTINLFLGLSVGVSVMVAQQLGARQWKDLSETVHTAIAVSLLGGLAVAIFGYFATRQLLTWMNSPADVIDLATVYTKIYFLGMPANLLYTFGSSILRAAGDTKRPLYYLTISGAVNVILNLILVIVFHLDVVGVAVATVVSQVLSAVLVLIALIRSTEAYRVNLREVRIYKDKMFRMIRLGLPAGIQGVLFSISNIMIQSSINSFGSQAIAGNTAACNLDGFLYVGMNSVYHAGIAFTGQNVGAKRYDRIGKITKVCVSVVMVIGVSMGILFYLCRMPLLHIYTDDPMVIEFASLRLSIMVTTYFLCGVMDVICAQLRAMGSSVAPMLVSVLGVCAFRLLWIYTIFSHFPTAEVLFISYPISWGLTAIAHFVCYLFLKRKLIRRKQMEAVDKIELT